MSKDLIQLVGEGMAREKRLDAETRPLRETITVWAQERDLSLTSHFDHLLRRWVFEIRGADELHITAEVDERGVRCWRHFTNSTTGSKRPTTPRGIKMVLNDLLSRYGRRP